MTVKFDCINKLWVIWSVRKGKLFEPICSCDSEQQAIDLLNKVARKMEEMSLAA